MGEIDKELGRLTARASELELLLADREVYAHPERFPEVLSEYGEVKERISELEPEWLALAEELEDA